MANLHTCSVAAIDCSVGKPRTNPVLRQTEPFPTGGRGRKSWEFVSVYSDCDGPLRPRTPVTDLQLTESPSFALLAAGAVDAV
jgi:hypothetical protein